MTTQEAKKEQRSRCAFNQVFESYRYLLKEDLARFAHRKQKMITEMKLFSANEEFIQHHLEIEFTALIDEILKEQEEKPRSRGMEWSHANIQNIS
jgi:hypothetical protein